jgi:hypothetical protein
LRRVVDRDAARAAGAGERGEVDRLQLAAVLRMAKEHHLLPLDHAKRVVLDHHDLHRKLVLHAGGELRHQHGEAAVADEGEARTVRMRDLRGDDVRQAVDHGSWASGCRRMPSLLWS